jgi:predicted transcriptional regulator
MAGKMAEHADLSRNTLELVARIVAAFVGNNTVAPADLAGVITSVHATLSGLGNAPAQPVAEALVPAVPIKKSIAPDFLICLEDGRKLKMLKRHLMSTYGLTPDQYRAKWKLASDYPMVAPNYAAHRSALALTIGLGRKRAEPVEPVPPVAPKKRPGRPKKAA